VTSDLPPTVAIIGGGFSGAATAYHLAKIGGNAVRILIFEPREAIGAGLAYSTFDPSHRINVPAHRMTLDPEEPDQFSDWLDRTGALAGDPVATLPDGRSFPARQLFGRYVHEMLEPVLASGQARHIRTAITRIRASSRLGWALETKEGDLYQADVVVIATSHPPPVPPAILTHRLAGQPKFIPDPWVPGALDKIDASDKVLIVGTGLTMADVVASLDSKGHVGHITAISRRGQRSHAHAALPVEPYGDFLTPPSRTALDLLRRVRRAVQPDRPWQGLFDCLRTQGQEIWRALPLTEQRRLIRHIRPFWDTHRFRIAPQVDALLERRLANGSLDIYAASLRQAEVDAQGFHVSLKRRSEHTEINAFDAIVATTGPGHSDILMAQPFLEDFTRTGWAVADPTGLGLAVDEQSRLLGKSGANSTVFVAGPLARGQFGELMGLPEVTNHAAFVAKGIITALKEFAAPTRYGVRLAERSKQLTA